MNLFFRPRHPLVPLRRAICLTVCVAATALWAPPLLAERAPRSLAQLTEEADAIVVGDIVGLEVKKERSQIERGSGNYDWAVYSKIRVRDVEKGDFTAGFDLLARSFVIKSRKSTVEYMTPSGNHPIPDVGAQVRVFLSDQDGSWHVIFPNGYQPATDNASLQDAESVIALKRGGYTYLLPIELWLILSLFSIVATAIVRVVRYRVRRAARE